MQTTDIATKDADLQVCYGLIDYGREPSEAAMTSVKYLFSDLTDIRKYYIRLGFHLEEFGRCGYFFDFGYATLEEFCAKNLGMDKSAVSRCIGVYKNFNAGLEVSYANGIKRQGAACDLGERWRDYSYAQLCEMLPLNDEQRSKITPYMTIREIRNFKKRQKDVATSQQKVKIFDYEKYIKLTGAASSAYVKSCTSISGHDKVLWIFDKNGNRSDLCNEWVEILEDSAERLVIRL